MHGPESVHSQWTHYQAMVIKFPVFSNNLKLPRYTGGRRFLSYAMNIIKHSLCTTSTVLVLFSKLRPHPTKLVHTVYCQLLSFRPVLSFVTATWSPTYLPANSVAPLTYILEDTVETSPFGRFLSRKRMANRSFHRHIKRWAARRLILWSSWSPHCFRIRQLYRPSEIVCI